MTMTHPTFETLLDFVENRLPETTRDQVMAHLTSPCDVCQAEVQAISDMLQLLKKEQLVEPPPSVVRRAIHLFKRLQEQRIGDGRPRIMAHLLFDSRHIARAVAARGVVGQERQMLYSVEGLDIDLQVSGEDSPHTLRLIGQVMPANDDPSQVQGCQIRLEQEEEVTTTATADELGTFVFPAVVPGDYELWLDLPQAEVWIPSVIIGRSGTA
jgi:hypothetical protein